ncbi:MAG: hypothetical protein RH917_13110 [Lacipirellulaceae bacterium]
MNADPLPPWFDKAEAKRLAAFFAVVAIVALLWSAWPMVANWQQQRVVEALVATAESGTASSSAIAVRKLGELEQPAIVELTRIASSEQITSADVAQQQLTMLLAHWRTLQNEQLADEQVTDSLVMLADSLSMHAHRLGPAGQQWAEQLALDLLDATETLPPRATAKILSACDATLSHIPARRPRQPVATQLVDASSESLTVPQPDMAILAEQSGEDLPERFRDPPRAAVATPLPQASGNADEAERSPLTWNARSKQDVSQGNDEPLVENFDREPTIAERATNKAISVPSPEEARQLLRELSGRSSRDLLLELEKANRYRAAILREALRSKGYSDAEVTLFRRISSPKVADRRRLLELAPNLPADSARRLLVALTEDADADIRLAALTAFATTGDPRIRQIAQQRVRVDADDRVAKLASRILREQ